MDSTLPNPSLRTLLLGDDSLAGMAELAADVRRQGGECKAAERIDSIGDLVGSGWIPDLIVAFEAWPDQYSGAGVIRLLSLVPLARIVGVSGPWCESAGRTHAVWPLAVRVPIPLAAARIRRELALLREWAGSHTTEGTGNEPPCDGPLPLTASRGEIFEVDFGFRGSGQAQRIVSVVSPDGAFRRMLETGLGAAGFRLADERTATATDGPRPDAIVVDSDPWCDERTNELRSRQVRWQEATVVAATGFPRPETIERQRDAGFDAVWFKLSPLSQLVRMLG